MKLPSFCFCAVYFGFFAPVAHAQGPSLNDTVRIEVHIQSSQERKDIKGSSTDTVTQEKTLQISLSGKSKAPETRTAKWWAIGRDMKKNEPYVIDSGTFKVDLAKGPQKFESKKVTVTYTSAHSVVSGKAGGKGSVKKVPASGVRWVGYGVEVRDGDSVVGKVFDPADVEKEVR